MAAAGCGHDPPTHALSPALASIASIVDITDPLAPQHVVGAVSSSARQLAWGRGAAAAVGVPSAGAVAPPLPPPPPLSTEPLPTPPATHPTRTFIEVPPPPSVAACASARRAWLLGRAAAAVGRHGVPRATRLPALRASVTPLVGPPTDGGCVCCAAGRAGGVGKGGWGGVDRRGPHTGAVPDSLPAGTTTHTGASSDGDGSGEGRGGEAGAREATPATAARRAPTVEELDAGGYFDMTIQDAADALGVGVTTLKKACRGAGIPRWPFRERSSVARLLTAGPGAGGATGRRARAPRVRPRRG